MHLRFVELFCDVVQLRSFSKAAAAHGVSQSAVSQAVNQLEMRLGTELIDRSKRPFELTPAGQIYHDGCRELLEGYRAVEDRVRNVRDRVKGLVRVAAIYSVGLLQMDSYVRRFHELYPEARLRVEYLHPEQVYEQLLKDEADIGLLSFPRDRGEFSSVAWEEQPMVLVVPPEHRLAGAAAVSVADIAGEAFVGFTEELTIRKEVDRWLKRSKVHVKIVHEFDNIENIKRAIEVGSGIAILPAPTVRREVDSGSLRAIRFADVDWRRPLGIVHKRQKTLGNAARRFIDLLRQDPSVFPREEAEAKANGADVPMTASTLTDEPPAPAAPPPIMSEAGAVKSKQRRLSSHR